MGNKIRFEVFKRDGFTCQYCGRTPPNVILEVDHIVPVSLKGKNNIDNYLTSCLECNRGKGKHPLTKIPQPLKERMELIKERELQIKEYEQVLIMEEERVTASINKFYKYLGQIGCGEVKNRFTKATLKVFFARLPEQAVIDAIDISWSRNLEDDDMYSPRKLVKYFCGVCWNKINGTKPPYEKGVGA